MSLYRIRQLNKINSEWIVREIEDKYLSIDFNTTFNSYLNECCFFVTVMFDWHKLSRIRQINSITGPVYEFEAARLMFRSVCSQMDNLAGVKGPRSRPLAIFATDYEGSKFGSFKEFQATNIHLHSIWCGDPGEGKQLGIALRSFRTRYDARKRHVQSVHVRSFDAVNNTIDTAASYITKAWTKDTLHASVWSDLMMLRGQDSNFNLVKGISREFEPKRMMKKLKQRATRDDRLDWEREYHACSGPQ